VIGDTDRHHERAAMRRCGGDQLDRRWPDAVFFAMGEDTAMHREAGDLIKNLPLRHINRHTRGQT